MSAEHQPEASQDQSRENTALARLHHDLVKAKLKNRIAELRTHGVNIGHSYIDTRPQKTKADRRKSLDRVQIVTKVNNDWLSNPWSN